MGFGSELQAYLRTHYSNGNKQIDLANIAKGVDDFQKEHGITGVSFSGLIKEGIERLGSHEVVRGSNNALWIPASSGQQDETIITVTGSGSSRQDNNNASYHIYSLSSGSGSSFQTYF